MRSSQHAVLDKFRRGFGHGHGSNQRCCDADDDKKRASVARSRYGPAALAALLLEAPQCVPYAQRVEIFRSLIVGLKQTCAKSASGSCGAVPAQWSTDPSSTSPIMLVCTMPYCSCSSAWSSSSDVTKPGHVRRLD
jgi:hypothetical protein